MSLTLQAIKIRQKDKDIYLTAIRAGDLLKRYDISWWKRESDEGYQRPLKEARVNEIKNYLKKDLGTFPTSILANVRGKIEVKSLKLLDNYGDLCEITIPDESLPIEVIDGQHRVQGLRAAVEEDENFANYPLIVSLFTLPNKYDEMLQFHIVNSRAKNVPTDLAQRHLYQMSRKIGLPMLMLKEGERSAIGAYVTPVVDKLMTDPKSVWYQRVQLPDQASKDEGQIIRQRPLADSIYYIIKEKNTLMKDLDKLTELLKDYWNALAEIFPQAFSDPEHYTIQRTPGVYSLHMVFPEIYNECEKANDFSKEHMKGVLERMFDNAGHELGDNIDDDFWSTDIYVGNNLAQSTSMKLMRALAQYFREAVWQ